MKNNLTEIVFILDESGSMSSLQSDTIGGFNSLISKQKEEEGEALVSAVMFNHESRVVYDRVPLEKIRPMNKHDYCPQGSTALLDAVGDAVHHIGNVHKYARSEDVPQHTIFIITTDGMENASRRYDSAKVKKLIEKQKNKYGWEFIFLGANIDSVETAGSMGISADTAVDCCADEKGVAMQFMSMCKAVAGVRKGKKLCESREWREDIDRDTAKRR